VSDLAEDVRRSFHDFRRSSDDDEAITIVKSSDEDLAPAFSEMREYYSNRLMAITRRGYRHFAGSTLPTNSTELLVETSEVMGPLMIDLLLRAFCDGVLISHQQDIQVKISWRFGLVGALFSDASFRENSTNMAKGFVGDDDVTEFFGEFVRSSLVHISHISGFAHSEVKPDKVWDVWMIAGASVTTTAYLAGNQLGTTWRERDVLDGIAIATEDHRGSDGEDKADRGGAEAGEG